ncbi:cellulose-binding protein [Streptomyces sp. WAC05374]|uniref:cellulose-binding protein n=1 Tax=Streptomyces sp. WAC05374 TaxID=2487420 RepID=UPI000F890520|nr:cellulose-binding protein [Streptomyces sp. WAC05374]RST05001.1 cellulose-binding protein [Streptomyces sp. WAC05374]TDF47027.1 cellulose-binding protein [Streptomyces sp. WAC05374]TDF57283.1 cellulose-binding protein [Streptomyces sp. WAC05374]TDF61387.1 cellulose-binding protein [Streptomyces sp. WAC05374]
MSGFAVVWGRGYRTEQVDRAVAGLEAEREAAGRRADELAVRVGELAAEAARLREFVAELPPQRYETLSRRAQEILALAEEEADALRADALDEARRLADEAEADARSVRDAAREAADAVRGRAGARAEETVAEARRTAGHTRAEALAEAEERRGEGLAALREARGRAERLVAAQEARHTERREALEREVAAREAELAARHEELTGAAEARLAEAERALAEAAEQAWHGQEEADARAGALLAEARLRAERVERETARVLREHETARDEVRAHMAHVRSSLAALTGRTDAG